jgi:peptidoglycan-associated lipoprotein
MIQWLKAVPVGLVTLVMAACTPSPVVDVRGGQGEKGSGTGETQGAQGVTGFQGHPLDDPASPLSNRVIYFDFDSSDIQPEDQELIAAHAAYLAANENVVVTLEGHGDERGSREYNLALGDQRGQAVRRLMLFQGAGSDQVHVTSFGEERPADAGHTESAWVRNRRVEIIY